jgi:hypothetical protein
MNTEVVPEFCVGNMISVDCCFIAFGMAVHDENPTALRVHVDVVVLSLLVSLSR